MIFSFLGDKVEYCEWVRIIRLDLHLSDLEIRDDEETVGDRYASHGHYGPDVAQSPVLGEKNGNFIIVFIPLASGVGCCAISLMRMFVGFALECKDIANQIGKARASSDEVLHEAAAADWRSAPEVVAGKIVDHRSPTVVLVQVGLSFGNALGHIVRDMAQGSGTSRWEEYIGHVSIYCTQGEDRIYPCVQLRHVVS